MNRTAYMEAFSNTDGIKQFGDKLPTLATVEPVAETEAEESQLQSQIQTALLAFSSGVSVAADVVTEGFDTHENHDALHAPLLSATTAAIDYLWTYAGSLGIADRLVLVVGSDFGRTPHYNSAQGKDHWPIGSYMVMEKNASFTNRVVGQTDEGHNAIKLNVSSLKASSSEGVILKPSHFHKALRAYLGIQSSAFSLAGVEDISFFA